MRPSKKLDQQFAGPYEILQKKGHSYKLKLPDHLRIHPVFPAIKLRRAASDPLLGQRVDEAESIQVGDSLE